MLLIDGLEYRYLIRVPERDILGHVNSERFVTLLKTTLSEISQWIDILSKIEANLLSLTESKRRHIGLIVADDDLFEGALAAKRVHEELAVEREAHGFVLEIDHDTDHVALLALFAESVASLMPLARRLALEWVRVRAVCDVGDGRRGEQWPADFHRSGWQELAFVVPFARAYRVGLFRSVCACCEPWFELLFRLCFF